MANDKCARIDKPSSRNTKTHFCNYQRQKNCWCEIFKAGTCFSDRCLTFHQNSSNRIKFVDYSPQQRRHHKFHRCFLQRMKWRATSTSWTRTAERQNTRAIHFTTVFGICWMNSLNFTIKLLPSHCLLVCCLPFVIWVRSHTGLKNFAFTGSFHYLQTVWRNPLGRLPLISSSWCLSLRNESLKGNTISFSCRRWRRECFWKCTVWVSGQFY